MTPAQGTLALPATAPRVTTPVRRLRGILVFDDDELAHTYLRRHGEFYKNFRGTLMQVRVRSTLYGALIMAWNSGHPWVLGRDGVMRVWRPKDVRA